MVIADLDALISYSYVMNCSGSFSFSLTKYFFSALSPGTLTLFTLISWLTFVNLIDPFPKPSATKPPPPLIKHPLTMLLIFKNANI